MPDPDSAPELLEQIGGLVHDWEVPFDEADEESWSDKERSCLGAHDDARALIMLVLKFATHQGAVDLTPDSYPAVPDDTDNASRDDFVLAVSEWLQAPCPMPKLYRTAEGEMTSRWEALAKMIQPARVISETIFDGHGYDSLATLETALVRTHLKQVDKHQDDLIAAAAAAAHSSALADAHVAALAVAAAAVPGAGAGAGVAAGGSGYSRQAVQGYVVSETMRMRIAASYMWILVLAAVESKDPSDFSKIFIEPSADTHPLDNIEFTAIIGFLCMLISFCSQGVTSKSSTPDEKTFYAGIAGIQSVLPKILFHSLQQVSASASGTGRIVSFPADIEDFSVSFLALKLMSKSNSIMESLWRLSPHQDDFLAQLSLAEMTTKHMIDTVCSLLDALSLLFPVFAGSGASTEFRTMLESFLELSIDAVAYPGGLQALYTSVYRRVILEWADQARSCMLTNPKLAAPKATTPFVTLAVRLTQAALRLNPISAAAVTCWLASWDNVRQARAFGMPGSSSATGEQCYCFIFPDCNMAVSARQIQTLQRDVALLKAARQTPARDQRASSGRAEKRGRERTPSGKGKGGAATGAGAGGRGGTSPAKKTRAPAAPSPAKSRSMNFSNLIKIWGAWLERKGYSQCCLFVFCLGKCTPHRGECSMCKRAVSDPPGANGAAPSSFGPTFFKVAVHRECAARCQHDGGFLLAKLPAHYT